MIAKFKNCIDFSCLVSYANDIKSDEKRGRLLSYQGVCVVSNETIADSINTHLRRPDSRGRVRHLGQPVKHVSISFSPEDAHRFPDNEDGDRFMAQLVDEWLRGMDITNAQYIVARHFDKSHPHCHLVFNRIDLDGNVISAFNERIRSAEVCREIKLRHGLTFGNQTGEKVNRDRLCSIQQLKFDIKSAVIAAADSSSSWDEFQRALETHGIETCFSINRSTGEIRGISFAKDGSRFAGSKLSKQKLTYGKLAAKFGTIPNQVTAMASTPTMKIHAKKIDGAQPVSERWVPKITPNSDDENVIPTNQTYEEPVTTLVPLSAVIELLSGGPAVVQSSGGGTSNDLDWNDERRRRQEAQENQYIHKPFKRRR